MLVLSRKEHEELLITTPEGRQIRICIARLSRHQVRIGIDAEREVEVFRPETIERELAKRKREESTGGG